MFKIVWDREHNGVWLTQSPRGEALNISPRPVFYEELDFLHLAEQHGWQYPHCREPLLWACERRYFYRGEVVLEVHGGNLFDRPSVEPRVEGLRLEPIDIGRLREVNEDAMFIIEHEAMNFIADTYRRYAGLAATVKNNPDIDFQQLAERQTKKSKQEHVVVREACDSFDIMPLTEAERQGKKPVLSGRVEMFIASFSGGKDSQVVLDLCTRALPPEAFLVIYSDTGYELPTSLELYDRVQQHYHALYPELQFHTARNHQPVLYYWDQMGSPSNTHRWCCGVMKTAPLYLKLKELSGLERQPHVLSYIGTRAEESLRRSTYDKIAKDAKHTNVVNVSPILDWNATEIWLYMIFQELPFNDAYRKGYNRVGCILCPFGSDWTDHLATHIYPQTAQPFVGKIEEIVKKRGVKDLKTYIGSGNWKLRAGGISKDNKASVTYGSDNSDFVATIASPSENIFEWIKVLGGQFVDDRLILKDKQQVKTIHLHKDDSTTTTIRVDNVGDEIMLLSHLKRILNKSAYCVHCELCEVECPVGALAVTPKVHIDETKCIHCHRCLDFHEGGCITANSIKQTEGIKMEAKKDEKTTINRYNTFGYREHWLAYFMENRETYFDNNNHGLTIPNQFTPFLNYLRDSEILEGSSRKTTDLGMMLSSIYSISKAKVWEVIWINLFVNSEIFSWYANTIEFNRLYAKSEIEVLLEETLPQYGASTRKNALASLQDTLNQSPIGYQMKVGEIRKEKGKPFFYRRAYNDLSLVGVAYSLYRYAEKVGRKDLTVGELYNEQQREGIVRQFGIERDVLERKLRSLQEEQNRVLSVELNMGLDNINLRTDLTSMDVLRMLL